MRGALVTGAASGIGAAISEALVHAGYNVVLFDIAPAEKTLDKLLAIRNQSALIHQGDARKIEDIRAAIKTVQDHFSPFCVLLNCAGIARISLLAESQRIIDINFTSIVHFTSEACHAMRNTGQGGVIVNIASAAGTIPIPYTPVYAATKAGVIHLTRSLGHLKASDNIRVCAIAPTYIDTPMVQAIEPAMREALLRDTKGLIPIEDVVHVLMKFVTEDEHAGVVLKMVPGRVFAFPPTVKRAARL